MNFIYIKVHPYRIRKRFFKAEFSLQSTVRIQTSEQLNGMNFVTTLSINAKIRFSNNNSDDTEKLLDSNKERDSSKFANKDLRSKYPKSKVPYKKFDDTQKEDSSKFANKDSTSKYPESKVPYKKFGDTQKRVSFNYLYYYLKQFFDLNLSIYKLIA